MDNAGKSMLKFAGAAWLLLMANIFSFAIVGYLPPLIQVVLLASLLLVDTLLSLSALASIGE